MEPTQKDLILDALKCIYNVFELNSTLDFFFTTKHSFHITLLHW